VAKGTRKKPTTIESDSDREIKKALRIAYEVRRAEWLSGDRPMTPPGEWVPIPPAPKPVTAPVPLNETVDSGTWIVTEAGRMKAAGEIPAHITKTSFAKALADRMRRAAAADPSIRPIKWQSIANRLAKPWEIWPITSIKIPT
jgi:hypothetical protein